jgi:FkbM family methyltransferase
MPNSSIASGSSEAAASGRNVPVKADLFQCLRSMAALLRHGRMPNRRALAAAAKLQGFTLQRRWPFISTAKPDALNLAFEDVLAFQFARARSFFVLVVGAYDGIENDPLGQFVLTHECSGVFLEPQSEVFERLRQNYGSRPSLRLVNAAVDQQSGTRELFTVRAGPHGLPRWTEQLASFSRSHIEKHEDRAPGLSEHIVSSAVRIVTFSELIELHSIRAIDVLQIDAEGVDALLLGSFPFDRIRPGVVYYEIAHMAPGDLEATRSRLRNFGYRFYATEAPTDEMAVLL